MSRASHGESTVAGRSRRNSLVLPILLQRNLILSEAVGKQRVVGSLKPGFSISKAHTLSPLRAVLILAGKPTFLQMASESFEVKHTPLGGECNPPPPHTHTHAPPAALLFLLQKHLSSEVLRVE